MEEGFSVAGNTGSKKPPLLAQQRVGVCGYLHGRGQILKGDSPQGEAKGPAHTLGRAGYLPLQTQTVH